MPRLGRNDAAYRSFDNDSIDWRAITAPHWQQTQQRMAVQPVVLRLQDTTELDFNGQGAIGLGPFGLPGPARHALRAQEPGAPVDWLAHAQHNCGLPEGEKLWRHPGGGGRADRLVSRALGNRDPVQRPEERLPGRALQLRSITQLERALALFMVVAWHNSSRLPVARQGAAGEAKAGRRTAPNRVPG
jgi:hypothetical protein